MRATAALLLMLVLAANAEAKEPATAAALGAIDAAPPGEADELYRCGK